jgi:hypothetical protein
MNAVAKRKRAPRELRKARYDESTSLSVKGERAGYERAGFRETRKRLAIAV